MNGLQLIPLCACVLLATSARQATAQALEGCGTKWEQASLELLQITRDHIIRKGTPTSPVEISCNDMKFFADAVEIFLDKNLVVASGNVLFTQGGSRIGADRMEFDTKNRTGTFYHASGTVTLGDRVERSMFGTQEPDAYFYGEKLEKIGPKKYRVTKGGFTTCVQPSPRWEVTSGSVTLNLDDYAFMRNSLLKVKGVPVLYLPVLYYPIQEDDRATGFLIPVYGASTLQGQKISNAFFWAIGRSHDATFFHDWFSKTGQGMGAEYRYMLGSGSGNLQSYWLDEHAADLTRSDGSVLHRDPRRSYRIDGGFNQTLSRSIRARGHAQYFSDITVQQLYNHDVLRSTNRQRRIGGDVTGTWGPYLVSGTVQRDEVFYASSSSVGGSLPRVAVSRAEKSLGALPLYVQINGEYAALVREDRSGTGPETTSRDRGLQRMDVTPTLRVPFTRWPFLTINSSAAWRATWWSRSLDPATQVPLDDAVSRRYFDLQSTFTGPTFNRVFNTPDGGYAEKYKHIIEPNVTIRRVSAIDVLPRILVNDGTDYIVGNVTSFTYGLTNRLYAKRRQGDASASAPREIVGLTVSQSYYTDANAVRYDPNYQSSFTAAAPRSPFTPIRTDLRVAVTDTTQGQLQMEYDTRFNAIRSVTANGRHQQGRWMDVTAGWRLGRAFNEQTGEINPDFKDHSLHAVTSLRTPANRFGGAYDVTWDIGRSEIMQQRMTGYYNAQCCGFAAEYQTYNFFAGLQTLTGVSQDRRFTFSVTLAGIGTFSPPMGGLGGTGEGRR